MRRRKDDEEPSDLVQWLKEKGRGKALIEGSVGGADLRELRKDQYSPTREDKPCLFEDDEDDWPPKDKKNHGKRQHRGRRGR